MVSYLLRRSLIGIVTLTLITMLIYTLIRNMPGDATTLAMSEMTDRAIKQEQIERMKAAYGLNNSIPVGYSIWLKNLFQFDMGSSISKHRPVSDLIMERIGPTLLLSITSLVLTFGLSIPFGLYASARAGKGDEQVLSLGLYILYSLPSFVAALFLQYLLAVRLNLLPLFGMTSDQYLSMTPIQKTWDLFIHSVMPVACYTYGSLAYYTRFIRANMEEVVRQDYIRTALAKGVPPRRVLIHHAFRNTMIPLVTMIGLVLPSLLSGSVIIEQIFAWPGMGRLFFESIRERDYPTIMGLTLIFSALTLLGQLLSDILYAVVDPRVNYE